MNNVIVTKDNAYVGMKVVRGRDWGWDEQDHHEGKPCIGKICGIRDSKEWVDVKWNNGKMNSYRIGHEEQNIPRYDLYVEEEELNYDIF